MKQPIKVEYLPYPRQQLGQEKSVLSTPEPSRRKIFVISFLLSLIIGLIINYSRPAVFRSSAILLTSAATAVDQDSSDVDFQHVTIQKQKLLSQDLLRETLSRIKASSKVKTPSKLGFQDIRNMLDVEAIKQTNLLKMVATGSDPDILPVVINTWIDAYLDARALSVKHTTHETVELINNELAELGSKIKQARKALDIFRKTHDISSIVREENEALTTLKGLTQAMNKANENVIKTKARLDAVNQAIALGLTVVPEREQQTLSHLEKRYQELTEKLAEFDKRFTRDYLALQPSLKFIPEQIKKLEKEIRQQRSTGKKVVLTKASQEYHAARQVAYNIRLKLDEHKKKAADFSTLFSQHQTLMDDLKTLEQINREALDRLVKIESKQVDKYPQVDVVERASINPQAVSPDYRLGTLIVFILSLIIAFFLVWMFEFLNRGKTASSDEFFPFFARVENIPDQHTFSRQSAVNVIEQQNRNELPHLPHFQRISDELLKVLLNHADKKTEQLILLLLSGLTLEQIARLTVKQIDLERSVLVINDNPPRRVPLGKRLRSVLKDSIQNDLWDQRYFSVEELKAMLLCAVVDAGVNELDGSAAEKIRQSYIIYLVEQGLRLVML